jgi:hypothetical protein
MSETLTKTIGSPDKITSHYEKLVDHGALLEEIGSLRLQGFIVNFDPEAKATDPAYDNPKAIHDMYHRLDKGGVEYDKHHRSRLSRIQMLASSVVAGVQLARKEILYSPDKMPWHKQAGQAVALLTIAFAHELASEKTDGIYPTMSGMLGDEIFDVRFDDRADDFLKGKTIEEANNAALMMLNGKSSEQAARATARRIESLRDFIKQPISEEFKQIVQYCTDSLGIRDRMGKVREVVSDYTDDRLEKEPDLKEMILLSVGCGTALPIFEVARALKEKGIKVTIILLDQDPIALAAAQTLAEKPEFNLGDSIELHCQRLFSKTGKAMDLSNVIKGRKIDIVEDTGLREYLTRNVYVSLTKALWASLSPGGLMSTGNMNSNRLQPEFLHGLMGWSPTVRMRKIAKGFELHEASGIKKGQTDAFVTADGTYTLFISQKA